MKSSKSPGWGSRGFPRICGLCRRRGWSPRGGPAAVTAGAASPAPCFGELLHLDSSDHAWLALCPGQRQTLAASDRALILATLQETKWVLAGPKGAAVRLGLNRSTLAFRMKKLGIVRPWQAGEAAGEAPWRVRMG